MDQLFSELSPATTAAVIAVIVVVVLVLIIKVVSKMDRAVTALMHRKRDHHRRDGIRTYTNGQRAKAQEECHFRCEGTGTLLRCGYEGTDLQGDHWFPHSRGGATSLKNLVMLCPKCNRKKTDHIPTRAQTMALTLRRRMRSDYMPGHPTSVGEWLPRSYVSPKHQEKQNVLRNPFF